MPSVPRHHRFYPLLLLVATVSAAQISFRTLDPSVPYAGSASCATSGCHQELTTYTYLATALNNIAHDQEAETVLERAVATYPYTATLRIA